MKLKQAVFIVGPTASGKSQLALEVAVARGGLPIVNADSLQIYKGLKIGSAMPSREDMKLTPHHLYAYVDKGKKWTAADYVRDVEHFLADNKSQRIALFCGGSGFYIQALEKGMYEMPEKDAQLDQQVQEFILQKGWVAAYEWLLSKDPSLQRTIHLNDQYRIRRAIEMIMISGGTPSQLQKKLTPSPLEGIPRIKVALYAEKELLKERVEHRAKKMIEAGFIEEVEELLAQGLSEWPPLKSVGYNEVCQFLRGEIARQDLVPTIAAANVKLIKKQLTWFKRDTEIHWFHIHKLASAKDYVLSQLVT